MKCISRSQPYNTLTPGNRIKKMWHNLIISPVASTIFIIGIYFSWISVGFHFGRWYWVSTAWTQAPLVGSMLPLGAVLGTLPIGILADKYGRKLTACFSVLPMIISSFVISWTNNGVWSYMIRFFAGMGCGASSVVIPIYLYEIADESFRRNITRFIHLYINCGFFIALVVDFIISMNKSNGMIYPIVLSCCLIPILAVPESPTWLLARGRKEEAERMIRKLTGNDVKLESTEPAKPIGNVGYRLDTFKLIRNKKDVALILGLIVFQQLSAIGALSLYSMNNLNYIARGDLFYVALVLIPLVSIVVAYFNINLVSCLGEKRLLVSSTFLMTVTSLLLAGYSYALGDAEFGTAICWVPMILLLVYLFAFNMGLGPVPWIMIGKMFPNSTRKLMYNLALTCAWATLFITTLRELLDHVEIFFLFLIHGFINLISEIFTIFAVPKTINKVDEESSDDLDTTNTNLITTPVNV